MKLILKFIGLLCIVNTVFLFSPPLTASPDNQEVLKKLVTDGVMFSFNAEPEKAIPLFNKALELSPNNKWILKPRAEAYRKIGDNKKALADYKKIIDLAQTKAEKHYETGRMYWAYKKHETVLMEFDKAINLDKLNANYFHCRGIIKTILGYYEESIQDYSKAIKLDPNDKEHYFFRAIAYRKLKKIKEAMLDEEMVKKLY